MVAAASGRDDLVQLFLDKGAHISVKTPEGFTALSNRVEVYHWEVRSVVFNIPYAFAPINEIARLERQFKEDVAQKVAQLDQPVWELLKPSQLRSLAGLLDRPEAGIGPPSSRPGRKRAVPRG